MALTDNLLYYYKLDETSGTAVEDSAGTNDATNSGATIVDGKLGKALDFESSEGDNVQTGSVAGLAEMSISCWIKPETSTGWSAIVGKDISTVRSFNFILSSNYIGFQAGTVDAYDDTTPIGTGTWKHVVVTFKDSTNSCILYVNGSAVKTLTHTGSPSTSSSAISIGMRNYSDFPNYFDGVIDEIGIWSRVLTSDEVASLYNEGTGISYPFVSDVTYNATAFSLSFTSKTPSYFLTKSINSALALNLTLNPFSSAIISLQLSTPAGTKGSSEIRKDRWGKTPTSFKSFGEKRYYQV